MVWSLEGSTADYTALTGAGTPFSEANTAYLGFGQGVDNDPFKGGARFINLSVEAIPEPATAVLVVTAAFGLLLVPRRRI